MSSSHNPKTTTQPDLSTLFITASNPYVDQLLAGVAHIHADCILHDDTLATFLPPLDFTTMHRWWHDQLHEVTQGKRHIIVVLSSDIPRSTSIPSSFPDHTIPIISTSSGDVVVVGVVSLYKPITQTGPFRGLVEKLLTSPAHRRRGLARFLMTELEAVARIDGRWNLMLDTTVGSPAENVYPRLGYTKVGYVKDYGFSPKDNTTLVDEVWFAKDLRTAPPL